jgi:hypothetical protein
LLHLPFPFSLFHIFSCSFTVSTILYFLTFCSYSSCADCFSNFFSYPPLNTVLLLHYVLLIIPLQLHHHCLLFALTQYNACSSLRKPSTASSSRTFACL